MKKRKKRNPNNDTQDYRGGEMSEATIKDGEYHPAADSAMEYIKELKLDVKNWMMHREALASTALSGNRLAELCCSTLDRLDKGEPVSDRYLLGLAWTLRNLQGEARQSHE